MPAMVVQRYLSLVIVYTDTSSFDYGTLIATIVGSIVLVVLIMIMVLVVVVACVLVRSKKQRPPL